jgi:hypothetical protein
MTEFPPQAEHLGLDATIAGPRFDELVEIAARAGSG